MSSNSPPRFDDSEDEDDFNPVPADLSDEEPVDNNSSSSSKLRTTRDLDDAPRSDGEYKDAATSHSRRAGENEDNAQNNEDAEDEVEQDDDEEDEDDDEDEDVQQVFFCRR